MRIFFNNELCKKTIMHSYWTSKLLSKNMLNQVQHLFIKRKQGISKIMFFNFFSKIARRNLQKLRTGVDHHMVHIILKFKKNLQSSSKMTVPLPVVFLVRRSKTKVPVVIRIEEERSEQKASSRAHVYFE